MEDSIEGLDIKIERYHDELLDAFKSATHDAAQENLGSPGEHLRGDAVYEGLGGRVQGGLGSL